MNKNDSTSPSVNLFPVMALSFMTLLATVAAIVMLIGLHNMIPKSPSVSSAVAVDEIGEINLDQNTVRFNLMKRSAGGKVEKLQEVVIPLESFITGFGRQQKFMDKMVEEGVIKKQ